MKAYYIGLAVHVLFFTVPQFAIQMANNYLIFGSVKLFSIFCVFCSSLSLLTILTIVIDCSAHSYSIAAIKDFSKILELPIYPEDKQNNEEDDNNDILRFLYAEFDGFSKEFHEAVLKLFHFILLSSENVAILKEALSVRRENDLIEYFLSERSQCKISKDFNQIASKMAPLKKRGFKLLLRKCLFLKGSIMKSRSKFRKPDNFLDIVIKVFGAIKFAVSANASANS
jgi:hypothetical protein